MELLRYSIIAIFVICGLLVILALQGVISGDWDTVAQQVAPVALIGVIITFAVGAIVELLRGH